MESIDRPLSLDDFGGGKKRQVVLYFDDVLDLLDKQSLVYKYMVDLLHSTLMQGRKQNTSAILVYHTAKMGTSTQKLYSEIPKIITFIKSGLHISQQVMQSKMNIPKKIFQEQVKNAKDSRFILWNLATPMYAVSQHHVSLF